MIWESRNVVDNLNGGVSGGVAADATGEGDGLAGDAALEGAEDELAGLRWVEGIET